MTAGELAVIRRTSRVNGRLFMPWMDDDPVKEQFRYPAGAPFRDLEAESLPMSPSQMRRFRAWRRPSEFMRDPKMIRMLSPYSPNQNLVGDCSFVSSLIIAANYERRFNKRLISSILYPQDAAGNPVYNPSGKYMVRLVYNGIPRKVIVDDRLPVDAHNRLFCSYSNSPGELWVSILEKAYMKLHGGYDFPGSTSEKDLYCLTGWLPENLRTQSREFDKERNWQRMVSGTRDGDVLITISTGDMSEAEEERLGLVTSHAYAVLDARQVGSLRMLQVKNPWAHREWSGRFSARDRASWTPEMQRALNFDPAMSSRVDNGIFWMEYNDVLTHFHSVHLNWNPNLLAHSVVRHAMWPAKYGIPDDSYNIGYNPQWALTFDVPARFTAEKGRGALVWVVMTRHETVTDKTREHEVGSRAPRDDAKHVYLGMYIYGPDQGGGTRIYRPTKPFFQGVHTSSVHSLANFEVSGGTQRYTLVLSQADERFADVYYTMQVFSRAPIKVDKAWPAMAKEAAVTGKWTAATAAGPVGGTRYFENPQFRVQIMREGPVAFRLELPSTRDISGNVALYRSGGGGSTRVTSHGEELLNGRHTTYSHKLAMQETVLPAGEYVAVVSTYHEGETGDFKLVVGTTLDKPVIMPLQV